MRTVEAERIANETEIRLKLSVDGQGAYSVDTGCGFLNHMLELFPRYGGFNLELSCRGDVEVDDHHTVEDVGIALGQAFAKALGDKRGITRYGNMLLPMDEALVHCALDISGRSFLSYQVSFPTEKIGTFDTQLVEEFFAPFSRSLRLTLHLNQMAGTNSHHIAEACFKGFGRALAQACAIDEKRKFDIPSTKGVL
jgi:imidazoleglycerol-phosphate dehydratase